MLKKKRKKGKTSIKENLTNYMKDFSIDIFGYEQKVKENIVIYANTISIRENIHRSGVNVRISTNLGNAIPQAHLYCFNNFIREVTIKELVNFFMGEVLAQTMNMEYQVKEKVHKYLMDQSDHNSIPLPLTIVRISSPVENVVVSLHRGEEFQEHLQIKELIKYFK